MSTTTLHGGRMARLLDETGEAWYHVYNRIACEKERMPFDEVLDAKETFERYLKFYTEAYNCELATYVVMGNHYHLVLRMKGYEVLSRKVLEEKAKGFYPNTYDQTKRWSDEHWDQFNERLFSLSDLMRNIQQGFARWYNKAAKRRGRFWADRFKSTLLYGEESLLECMQYVDLNPLRAGLVDRPEAYEFCGFYKRMYHDDGSLLNLKSFLSKSSKKKALEEYRSMLYTRGCVASKEKDHLIKEVTFNGELSQNFDLSYHAEAKDHFRFYLDGLVIGAKDKVKMWLEKLQHSGAYLRRKNPIPIKSGLEWYSVREQRSHYEGG